jgi:hypothetical protein
VCWYGLGTACAGTDCLGGAGCWDELCRAKLGQEPLQLVHPSTLLFQTTTSTPQPSPSFAQHGSLALAAHPNPPQPTPAHPAHPAHPAPPPGPSQHAQLLTVLNSSQQFSTATHPIINPPLDAHPATQPTKLAQPPQLPPGHANPHRHTRVLACSQQFSPVL